tara:strand:+ start:364 stop:540 length:177 start_codon:yes stop_codon:yes gene_type:complete
MNTIIDAKERVCESLINRVEYFDKLLEETDLINEKDKVKRLYNYKTQLLYRLEKVVSN